MSETPARRRVIVGVDTHKHVHVAVALDEFGGRIDAQRFTADSIGYRNLIDWAAFVGRTVSFGIIEGTGSYSAGLASAVRRRGFSSIDVLQVEMIRTIKVAKDVAVKARTAAISSLKAVLVNAPLGVGADVAAQMLIVAGDNLERIHSEAAFAKNLGGSVGRRPALGARPLLRAESRHRGRIVRQLDVGISEWSCWPVTPDFWAQVGAL